MHSIDITQTFQFILSTRVRFMTLQHRYSHFDTSFWAKIMENSQKIAEFGTWEHTCSGQILSHKFLSTSLIIVKGQLGQTL